MLMTEKNQYKEKLTEELGEIIVELSQKIPNDDIFQLKKRLNYSFNSLAECIHKTYAQSDEKRIDRIRKKIRAHAYLEECKDYVTLVSKMKYADTTMCVALIENIEASLNGQTLEEATIDPYKNRYIN